MKDFAWASQDIRDAIKREQLLVPNFSEDRIQPSSFEPSIGDEVYIIDTEYQGLFRISRQETVYENLIKLPSRQRRKVNIENGFELKKGFSYLIPLEETITLQEGQYFRSSPKSSLGRLFVNTRLIADYNPSLNEGDSHYCEGKEIKMWLYVQPLAFNLVVYPGLTLNQIRIFNGYSSKLSPLELVNVLKKNPILYTLDIDGEYVPADSVVTDGLTIHLNLSGNTTEGVVGLRAIHNPMPVDLSKKGYYDVEDFFEPIHKKDRVYIQRGEYYLLSSKEVLKVPKDLSIELRDYSQVGFSGPLHYAGFIDNGFEGDLVYEVRSDEISKALEVTHNMPVSKLDIFMTHIPDKIYGQANNNYKFQIGPKPAKYFQSPDYKYIARKYSLLNKEVLSVDRNILLSYRNEKNGFEVMSNKGYKKLANELDNGLLRSRYICEDDDLVLQVASYVVFVNKENKVFVYKKGENLDFYPEKRLFNKWSVGIGCHLTHIGMNGGVLDLLKEELKEKGIDTVVNKPVFVGTVVADELDVDRAHFGLVYIVIVDDIEISDKGFVQEFEWVRITDINSKWISSYDFETWTQMVLPDLKSSLSSISTPK